MDRKQHNKITDAVWSCTVGCGEASEKFDLKSVENIVGRALTKEEISFAQREWDKCQQMIEQP